MHWPWKWRQQFPVTQKNFWTQVNKKFLDANVLRTSTNQKATINNPCKNPEEWNQISQNPSTWGIHGWPWQWHLVSFTAVCCIASPPDCIDSFKPFKKTFWVATTFSSQAENIATEQRIVNSEQKLQNKQWCTFTNDKRYQLQSNYLRLTTESDSDHHAFHQSTQCHMVVILKACGERGGA